jgi:hypothetical protein
MTKTAANTKPHKVRHHAKHHMKKSSSIAKQAKAEGESTATEMKEHKAAARHSKMTHKAAAPTKKPATTDTSDATSNSTQQ